MNVTKDIHATLQPRLIKCFLYIDPLEFYEIYNLYLAKFEDRIEEFIIKVMILT